MHVQNQLNDATAFVNGCDENGTPFAKGLENTTTCDFRLKIQNPKNAISLQKFKKRTSKLSADAAWRLTGLEVAFDTYLPNANIRALAEIATDLYRFSTNKPEQDWNLYRQRGEGRTYVNTLNRRDLVERMADGWQLTDARSKEIATRYHVYVKTTDNGGKLSLPANQHRARFEVTLRGDALPCQSLEELMTFDFTRLADHFKFRKLAPDDYRWRTPTGGRPVGVRQGLRHWYVVHDASQLGLRGEYKRPSSKIVGSYLNGKPAQFRRITVADDELSRRGAQDQLRKLTRRWKSIA